MNLMRSAVFLLLGFLTIVATAEAQITPVSPSPVPYASVSELNGLLASLEQTSQTTQTDLGKLRIEKWKMDSGYKKQTLANADSVHRNLQSALPEIMTQLRNSPEDLGASFTLYRNLDALYDVLSNVAESAGAFGSKDEFQSLSNDLSSFERSRRAFADRMESLSTAKEAELAQLRTQVKTLQAATPPPPPKKIVVDDNAPAKPAPKKKKPVPKPPTASNPSGTTPPTPPQTQPKSQ
jgi:hypothetical protein